jgi:C1A family cysteine protease
MLDFAELQEALANAGNPWRASPNPLLELIGSGDTNIFGLSITEGERADLLARAELLEQETGLLAAAGPPPPAADWRTGGWVTPARAQGLCQSCVAFATCGALEARLRIFTGDAGLDVDLSEAHLFSCGCPGGCSSGWNFEPALEHAQANGIGREADFPYEATDQACVDIKPVVRVTGWSAATTPEARKQTIASNGPVIGGMHVFADLPSYKNGVYEHVMGDEVGLHAVCIVGYDDPTGCWIVKNSWGPDWGEQGFFRIAYGQCGLDEEFPFIDPDVERVAPG